MQNGIDMGFDNGPFSAPSIVAFSEAVAKTVIEELLYGWKEIHSGISPANRKTRSGL